SLTASIKISKAPTPINKLARMATQVRLILIMSTCGFLGSRPGAAQAIARTSLPDGCGLMKKNSKTSKEKMQLFSLASVFSNNHAKAKMACAAGNYTKAWQLAGKCGLLPPTITN